MNNKTIKQIFTKRNTIIISVIIICLLAFLFEFIAWCTFSVISTGKYNIIISINSFDFCVDDSSDVLSIRE